MAGAAPRLRREAGRALSGRVPLALAVTIALLGGWGLGFGWRGLLCDRECTRAPRVVRRCAHPPLVADPTAPPRLVLLAEGPDAEKAERTCPGAPEAGTAPAAPAASPTPKATRAAPATIGRAAPSASPSSQPTGAAPGTTTPPASLH